MATYHRMSKVPLSEEDRKVLLPLVDGSLELLKNPDHWSKGFYAFDEKGETQSPTAPEAVCWCLMGAICKASSKQKLSNRQPVDGLIAFLEKFVEGDRRAIIEGEDFEEDTYSLARFNDHPTTKHEDVLNLLKKARKEIEDGAPVFYPWQ